MSDQEQTLRERLDAGQAWPAYTEVREVSCSGNGFGPYVCPLGGTVYHCSECMSESGLIPFDQQALIRLRALCGDQEALDMGLGNNGTCLKCGAPSNLPGGVDGCLLCPLGSWLDDVHFFAAKLPPARVVVSCDHGGGHGNAGDCFASGVRCKGVQGEHGWTMSHDTPAERYLLVVAAHAAGRACSAVLMRRPEVSKTSKIRRQNALANQALAACGAWIADPTPERERAWSLAFDRSDSLATWVPGPWSDRSHMRGDLAFAIRAAAKVLTGTRVREIASAAILEAIS